VLWLGGGLAGRDGLSGAQNQRLKLKIIPVAESVMMKNRLMSILRGGLGLAILGMANLAYAQTVTNTLTNWVAFNDWQRGTGTGLGVSAWSFPVVTANQSVGGPLTNWNTRTMLTNGMFITNSGYLNGFAGTSAAPNPGSPASNLFTTNIEWTASSCNFAATNFGETISYIFTNLTPGCRYNFRGAAVRGSNAYGGRWTVATVLGASSFVPMHAQGADSPGLVTNGWSPYGDQLLPNASVAWNCGNNLCGDLIGWDNIVPINSQFSIVCSNYRLFSATCPTNDGTSVSVDPTVFYIYTLSALRLEELATVVLIPPTITQQPADANVVQTRSASFTVAATGNPAPRYQWYKGTLAAPIFLDGQTNATYSIPAVDLPDANGYFAVAYNSQGSATSRVAQLTVTQDTSLPTFVNCQATPDLATDPTGNTYSFAVAFAKTMDTNTIANNNVGVYRIQTLDGSTVVLTPTSATYVNASNVILKAANPFAAYGYANFRLVAVAGGASGVPQIKDVLGNLMPVGTAVPVFWTLPLIPAPLYDTTLWDWSQYATNIGWVAPPQAAQTWQTYADTGINWFQGLQMFSGYYNQTGPDYGDSAAFGLGSIKAQLQPAASLLNFKATNVSYYRRRFFMPPATPGAVQSLSIRHVISDGAVMWLNGQEISRIRLTGGDAKSSYFWTNKATASQQTANVHPTESTNNPAVTPVGALVLNATNAFAVEVHQRSYISSDVVMGVELMVSFTNFTLGPAHVVSQPAASTTLTEGQGFSLLVTVEGDLPISYRWYHGTSPIPFATNRIYSVAAAGLGDAGNYYFIANNTGGASTSSIARVTVNADLASPQALAALGTSWSVNGASNVTVAFNKAMDPTSIQPARFALSGGGSSLTIYAATLVSNNLAVLTTAARSPGVDYTLAINGVTDTTASHNSCTTNLPVIAQFDIVRINDTTQVWSYDDTGVDRTPQWAVTNFIGAWKTGLQAFDSINGASTNRATVGGQPIRTQLNLYYSPPWAFTSNSITFYFQTLFNWPGTTNRATFYLNNLIDDGAAFYLNGVEFYETNMPSVRYAATNYCPIDVGTAVLTPPAGSAGVTVPINNLVAGSNLLCVEVRQSGWNSPDITFGANIVAALPSWGAAVVTHPKLAVQLLENGQVQVSWAPKDGVLMTSSDPAHGWVAVPGNPNPYTFTPGDNAFFKISK